MKVVRLFVLAAATFAVASTASAQSVETGRSGIPRRNLISANPIGILFEWYNGEYERALSTTTSVAVAASRFGDADYDAGDTRYGVLDGIARYYPAGRALRGFSIGVSVGVAELDEDIGDCTGCDDDSGTYGTVGIRGDYVWILGRDQRFAVATGLGARRVLGGGEFEGLPIGRLSIGWAW